MFWRYIFRQLEPLRNFRQKIQLKKYLAKKNLASETIEVSLHIDVILY